MSPVLLTFAFFPKQELLGSSPQKKKERAWRDGWHGLAGWHVALELGARGVWVLDGWQELGPAVLDGWHAAQELGACSTRWFLNGWHAALELGLAQFGWAARGSGAGGPHGVWMARGSGTGGAGGPRSLDGWHAALEQGARGFDACAGHF